MKTLAFFLSLSTFVLAACGTSSLGGNGDGGAGGGGSCSDQNNCVLLPILCKGEPNPVDCTEIGCADGFTCTPDADPTTACHPSVCACDEMLGWQCTQDCQTSAGGTCVANGAAPQTCNGDPSPLDCANIGCPDGYTCTPDPDPNTSCHPSACSCDATLGWQCTADCGPGSTCVQGL